MNMRLWSAAFHREDSRWTVSDDAGLRRSYRLLSEYQKAEPAALWRLETRGDIADWHPMAEGGTK